MSKVRNQDKNSAEVTDKGYTVKISHDKKSYVITPKEQPERKSKIISMPEELLVDVV